MTGIVCECAVLDSHGEFIGVGRRRVQAVTRVVDKRAALNTDGGHVHSIYDEL